MRGETNIQLQYRRGGAKTDLLFLFIICCESQISSQGILTSCTKGSREEVCRNTRHTVRALKEQAPENHKSTRNAPNEEGKKKYNQGAGNKTGQKMRYSGTGVRTAQC